MNKDYLDDLSKDQLEELKLKKEIINLSLSWWRKPSYLGIVIPSVLTLVTILVGIITGFIDLKKQEIGFNSKIEKIELDYNHYRDSIEDRLKTIDYEYKQKISENSRLIKDIDSLSEKYLQELDDYQQKTETLSEEARNKEYLTHINSLIGGKSTVWPLHNSSRALIELLKSKQGKDVKELIENTLLTLNDHIIVGNFNYILYKGTQEKQYLDKLLNIIDKQGDSINFKFWHIFSSGEWNCSESFRIAQKLILSIQKWKYRNQGASALGSIDGLIGCGEIQSNFTSSKIFFDGVVLSRTLSLDTKVEWYYRNDGLIALTALEPSAFFSVCSQIMVNERENTHILSQVVNIIDRFDYKLKDQLKKMNVPRSANYDQWMAWRNENSKLISMWITDENLEHLRKINR